jgi:hypothetical protein
MNSKELQIAHKEISKGIAKVDEVVSKNYLANLETHNVVALRKEQEVSMLSFGFVKITRIVADKEENFNEKLASVYSSLYTFFTATEQDVDGAIIMLICGKPDKVDYYLGIRHKSKPDTALDILCNSLEGNFPGSEIFPLGNQEDDWKKIRNLLDEYVPENGAQKKVSSVYAVPSLKTEKDENFVQGIENFIDTMAGKEYTALFVSTPISKAELEQRKRGFESMYTELSKMSEINLSIGINESKSEADGTSFSFTETFGESVSDSMGTSYSESSGSSSGGQGFLGTYGNSEGTTSGTSSNHTTSQNSSQAKGNSTSKTITNTLGSSKSATFTLQVKTIQEFMKKIELQLERIDKGEAYGLWGSACYFIADKPDISLIAANTYRSLLVGEKTSTDRSIINYWGNNPKETEKLMAYLHNSMHPVFVEHAELKDKTLNYIAKYISASNMVNGQELPLLMGLPQKSVSGVTSINFASFGRNVQNINTNDKDKRKIKLGCIYHLGKTLSETKVTLTANEFTKHCFVTGSTGSGKSNTIYRLLEEFISQKVADIKDGVEYKNVNFLIIEPAKGEYKKAFAKLPEINIFTTNAKYHKLLKLNPFSFCDDNENGIHVLEHLDRLIEIFSACWPLYAAMPAVLKESFEKAYERVGWDVQNSIYIGGGKKKYPSFKTVLDILPEVINASEFSAENKGNYTGALVTRVKSLTMGIMGTIFSSETEISNKELFDENTVVDISRVGSSETKSLIMGILILKLNEYRMSEDKGTNLPLRHITVLEEAHNILKRTSTDQSQEGANLAGKSVEMISNSIAEMRTYGEGFIIVDQSPAMVAQSAITNTNTKIIMRLADFGDCEAVGRSVSLNDEQIKEISRLNQGVAIVHQSSWKEAVLTKIDRNTAEDKYGRETITLNDLSPLKKLRGDLLTAIFEQRKDDSLYSGDLESIIFRTQGISKEAKDTYKRYIENIEEDAETEDKFAEIVVNILECKGMIGACVPDISPLNKEGKFVPTVHDVQAKQWLIQLEQALKRYVEGNDKLLKELVYYIVKWIYKTEKQKKSISNLLRASQAAVIMVFPKEYSNKK